MSQPTSTAQNVIPSWVESSHLTGMLRGIERESLRIQTDGFLSQADHPQALGSALTHPHITTDYSEALMEFITPPKETINEALEFLLDIHAVVYRHLENDEKLWPLSMPCLLEDDEEKIRLAQYGSSNIGKFKTLYRHGLGVRYGRKMQTIAGIHYNLSFPDTFFEQLQQEETDSDLKQLSLQDYRSYRYLGLIRNFIRLTPMVMFLLGASPSVCQCFMAGREHHLLPLVRGTLYSPFATALRMGRFGYQNSAQKQLGIHYNDIQSYLTGLQSAVKTPYAPFSYLGLDDEQGEPIQINDHVLQIENEYYSLVRPKQVPMDGETPSQALQNRGIGYVELRAVDVNPYSPIGIDESTAGFLEALALYCLLNESPAISAEEQDQIERNQAEVVERGRAPNAMILVDGKKIEIETWLQHHLDHIQHSAALLDQTYATSLYTNAIAKMQSRIDEVDETLSAILIEDQLQHSGSWGLSHYLTQQHAQAYAAHKLTDEKEDYFADAAKKSIEKQAHLEADQNQSFSDYLSQFR